MTHTARSSKVHSPRYADREVDDERRAGINVPRALVEGANFALTGLTLDDRLMPTNHILWLATCVFPFLALF